MSQLVKIQLWQHTHLSAKIFHAGKWGIGSLKASDHVLCGINQYFDSELLIMLIQTYFPIHGLAETLLLIPSLDERILCTFTDLPNINENYEKPIFVFAHFRLPHAPFQFGSEGERLGLSKTDESLNTAENRDRYLNQVKFANKKIQQVVFELFSNSNEHIIIIQSDHGVRLGLDWENPNEQTIKRAFNNFNAIYLPSKGKDLLYEAMTPVNTFRIIFNSYFDENYDLLDDKSFFSSKDPPYKFVDVTDFLRHDKPYDVIK